MADNTSILQQTNNFLEWVESISDKRVAEWPLVPSPVPIFSLTFAYIVFSCWLGPKIMEHYKPINLRMVLLLYNTAMTILNFHIFKELIVGSIDAGFSYPCQPFELKDDPKHMRIASAIWWYYVSKPLEFLDTIFFVLRKKNDQITFLHIYHHATMPCLWWIGVKWAAGGLTTYPPIYNAFIHVLMYTYYGIAAFGKQYQKYLWWKKYLTQLQLMQFCIAMIHSLYAWYTECPFFNWMYHGLNIYMVSFLVLFGNFYLQAYINKKRLVKGVEPKKEK